MTLQSDAAKKETAATHAWLRDAVGDEALIAGGSVQPRVWGCCDFLLRRVALQSHARSRSANVRAPRSGKFYAAMENLQCAVVDVRRS